MFEEDAFEMIPLRLLAELYLPSTREETELNDVMQNKIRIPGFQRNAVWKEDKVQALWDSILCHFPIGSILLARYGDFSEVGYRQPQKSLSDPWTNTVVDKSGKGFIVVDGQQRLNAIAFGYFPYHDDGDRLWIDLAGPKKKKEYMFDIYLCTRENPFGKGVSPTKLRTALEDIGKKNTQLAYLKMNQTFPYNADAPVPFYEFCELVDNHQDWEKIKKQLLDTAQLNLEESTLSIVRNRINEIEINQESINRLIRAIRQVVLGKEEENKYKVPAILFQNQGTNMRVGQLGKLFERINVYGEVPTQPELFFSALKLEFPEISNYVADINNDEKVGSLLKPTDIVLAAVRLVRPDVVELKLDLFDKKNITKENKEDLLDLMQSGKDDSLFKDCMKYAYEALHYNGKVDDIGLPRMALVPPKLRPRVWQTVVKWVSLNLRGIRARGGIAPSDRLNILRYAVLNSFNYFLEFPGGNSRTRSYFRRYSNSPVFAKMEFEILEENQEFPIWDILNRIENQVSRDEFIVNLYTPGQFSKKIRSHDILPNGFKLPNEDVLLMFAQRDYLNDWEHNRWKMDVDHILPSAWMNFRGLSGGLGAAWKVGIEDWYRDRVLDSIGNKRFWPRSLNREYRDRAPKNKYISNKFHEDTNDFHRKYFKLTTVQDVLDASFIQIDQAEKWMELDSSSNKLWDENRFQNFKQVVEERRCRMYERLYRALEFDEYTGAFR